MSEWLPSSRIGAATPLAMTSPGARMDASVEREALLAAAQPALHAERVGRVGCGAPWRRGPVQRRDVDA